MENRGIIRQTDRQTDRQTENKSVLFPFHIVISARHAGGIPPSGAARFVLPGI